eukprot:366417-Chlamydomonas_euryale.AAC.9
MNAKIQTTKRDSKAVQTGKDEEQVKQSVNAVGLEGFMARGTIPRGRLRDGSWNLTGASILAFM